jgi:hypothetical protein
MRRILFAALTIILMAGVIPNPAGAQDVGIKVVFKDGIYGGLAGTLVGGALLAFRNHPEDHLDLIAKGAAIGVITGVAYGFYDASRSSVAELESGTVYVGFPTTQFYFDSGPAGKNPLAARLNLFTWRY